MNATVINANYARLLYCCRVSGHPLFHVISQLIKSMTGLTVCPGENKTYDSVRLNQMASTRTSNSELNAKNRQEEKNRLKFTMFFQLLFLFVSHSDTKSGAKQLNRNSLS